MLKRTKRAQKKQTEQTAQTALEYILLLMAVVVVVLVGFKTYMPEVHEGANIFYNRAVSAMLGNAPRCGDGECGNFENMDNCPSDC